MPCSLADDLHGTLQLILHVYCHSYYGFAYPSYFDFASQSWFETEKRIFGHNLVLVERVVFFHHLYFPGSGSL
jgi:hypothetical protein